MSRMFSRPVSSSSTVAAWPVRPMLRRTASGSLIDIVSGDAAGATRGNAQRGQHPNDRRLAGAVGSEQTHDGALGHGEADPVDGLGLVEVLDQVNCLNSDTVCHGNQP